MADIVEYVEWVDSYNPAGTNWSARASFKEHSNTPVIVKSVGFVIDESAIYLTLAGHATDDQAAGALLIPIQAIVKRKKVRI